MRVIVRRDENRTPSSELNAYSDSSLLVRSIARQLPNAGVRTASRVNLCVESAHRHRTGGWTSGHRIPFIQAHTTRAHDGLEAAEVCVTAAKICELQPKPKPLCSKRRCL